MQPSQHKSNAPWIIVAAVLAVALVGGAGVALYFGIERQPVAQRNDDEDLPEVAEAFDNARAGTAEQERPAIEQTLQDLLQAPDHRKPEFFDTQRMVLHAMSGVQLSRARRQSLERSVVGNSRQLIDRLNVEGGLSANITLDVRRLERLKDSNDVVAYVVHRFPDGTGVKYRWWLSKDRNRWQIYDGETLIIGLRITEGMQLGLKAVLQPGANFQQSIQAFGRASQAVAAEDYDQVKQALADYRRAGPLPNRIDALAYFYEALVALNEEEWSEALKYIDQSERKYADAPMLPYLRATALLGLEEYDRAVLYGRKYLQLVGNDADGCRVLGEALRNQGNLAEAADVFATGLDEYASSLDNLLGLIQCLPLDQMQPAAQRIAASGDPGTNYDTLGSLLVDESDYERLAALVAACRETLGENSDHEYYEGLVCLFRGEPEKAETLFRAGLAVCPADDREYFESELRTALMRQQKYIDAYRLGDDQSAAFASLAQQNSYDPATLAEVAALHRQSHPSDPWLNFYDATVAERGAQLEAAARLFAQCLAQPDDEELVQVGEGRYLNVMSNLGRHVEALRTAVNKDDAFHRLARQLDNRAQANEFEALCNEFNRVQPGDIWIEIYRARVDYFRGRYRQAAERLSLYFDDVHADDRAWLEQLHLEARIAEGNPSIGYAAMADKREAFRRLARKYDCPLHRQRLRDMLALHAATDPDDPQVHYNRGRLVVDEQPEQAAEHYLAAWKADEPGYSRYLYSYCPLMVKLGRETEALAAAPAAHRAFETLAHRLYTDKQPARLSALCEAYAQTADFQPTSAWHTYQGLAAELAGDLPQAEQHLSTALDMVPPAAEQDDYDEDEYGEVLSHHCRVMVLQNKTSEAYAAAKRPSGTLDWLLDALLERHDWNAAISLVNLHGETNTVDYWTLDTLVDSLLTAGETDLAQQAFGRHDRSTVEPDLADEYRNLQLRIRYHQGQGLQAYDELGPEAFATLRQLCQFHSNAKLLKELIAAHHQRQPNDPELHVAEIELAGLEQDSARQAELLLQWQNNPQQPDWYRWRYDLDDVLVALARAGRAPEALALAEARDQDLPNDEHDHYRQGIIHALSGDHAQAAQAFDRCLEQVPSDSYRRTEIYTHEDLAPLIKTEAAYAPLREKYPPKEQM